MPRHPPHHWTLRLPSDDNDYYNQLLIYSQLFQYLSVNSLLHANQYGFRAKYSTELALNELVDRIYSQLDEKKAYCHIYGPVKSI